MFHEKKEGKRAALLSRSRGVERVFERERAGLSLSLSLRRVIGPTLPQCLRGKSEQKKNAFSIFAFFTNIKKKYSKKKKKKKKKKKRYGDITYTDTLRPRDRFLFFLSLSLSLGMRALESARKSLLATLFCFALVSSRFSSCFGISGQNESSSSSLWYYRRALLQQQQQKQQRRWESGACFNPWCFLISRRQRVKIRQCAVPQCAVRVKPFSCSQEYCCASWCRNLPWDMLIDAPPPLCRDCVIAYRPGCCGWCEQVPSQYYGGVLGCYDCLAYAVEVRFVPIIKPIYGRCEFCEWSPRRYISSPTFVNVVKKNVNIKINIFQKTIVQPPQPKESLGADECRNIGGCGFDAPTDDEVPADEPLTPDEAAAGDPQPGDLSEDQLTDAVLDPVDDPVTAGEQEPDVPDPIAGIDGVDVDGEEEEEEEEEEGGGGGGGGGEEEEQEQEDRSGEDDQQVREPTEAAMEEEGTLPDVKGEENALNGIDEGVDEQTDYQPGEGGGEGGGEQDYSSQDYSSQDYSSQEE